MQNGSLANGMQLILEAAGDLHFRPAAVLVSTAKKFEADVYLEHDNQRADGKSILQVVMLCIKAGARFTVSADGRDAHQAMCAFKELFVRLFMDEPVFDGAIEKKTIGPIKTRCHKQENEVRATKSRKAKTSKKQQHFMWKPLNIYAKEVCLAGDFNEWTPIPMTREKDMFGIIVELPPGKYQYKFIVDGEWREDPVGMEAVPNNFGTRNSVISI